MTDSPVGTLEVAVAHAKRLMERDPGLAERQAREILQSVPGDPRAKLILGEALRRKGDALAARAVLEPLAREQPRSAQTAYELGMALQGLGEADASIAALHRAVSLDRSLAEAWGAIGDQLYASQDLKGADAAYAEQIRASAQDPVLQEAAGALCDNKLGVAERLLRDRLKARPNDVAAARMLAEIAMRIGRLAEAEILLRRCVELAPRISASRHILARVLYRQQKAPDALPHLELLLQESPRDANYRVLVAACLGMVGDYGRAIEIYHDLLKQFPKNARVWLALGHASRTAGARAEAIAAYKRAVELEPGLGEGYWSLANLKTLPFSPAEVAAMEAQLQSREVKAEDQLHIHYALGKAYEDDAAFAKSFAHYAMGARLRLEAAPYDSAAATSQLARSKALFTREFFAERVGSGAHSDAPIFIVGLPRSGSTLVEQILASHSAVEGTMELPEIGAIARAFRRVSSARQPDPYPDILATVSRDSLRELGEEFLGRTRIYRKRGAPFFIDKMPNNFPHLGLIQLILPNAKIVDCRRHPMAACFSAFKQHFARGQGFSYDLVDLGRFYRDYVELMAHFDNVLPGRVYRVIYEDMVDDAEVQTRRLLDYCGLEFEAACLRFYDNDRAVRTASSEQVRQPIFRDGLEQWRNYEPWLGPLAEALGPTLTHWRG